MTNLLAQPKPAESLPNSAGFSSNKKLKKSETAEEEKVISVPPCGDYAEKLELSSLKEERTKLFL